MPLSAAAAQLDVNPGHPKAPSTQRLTHPEMSSNLRACEAPRPHRYQSITWHKEGCRIPVRFLLLLVRVVTEEQELILRERHMDGNVLEFNVGNLVH